VASRAVATDDDVAVAAGSDARAATFREPHHNPLARYQDPPRFPWRFMGGLLLVGVAFLVLGVLTAGDPVPPKVDNVLNPGDCVVIDVNGDAAERLCTQAHDGVVEILLTGGEVLCPNGSEPHRDRQGMGTACVRPRLTTRAAAGQIDNRSAAVEVVSRAYAASIAVPLRAISSVG